MGERGWRRSERRGCACRAGQAATRSTWRGPRRLQRRCRCHWAAHHLLAVASAQPHTWWTFGRRMLGRTPRRSAAEALQAWCKAQYQLLFWLTAAPPHPAKERQAAATLVRGKHVVAVQPPRGQDLLDLGSGTAGHLETARVTTSVCPHEGPCGQGASSPLPPTPRPRHSASRLPTTHLGLALVAHIENIHLKGRAGQAGHGRDGPAPHHQPTPSPSPASPCSSTQRTWQPCHRPRPRQHTHIGRRRERPAALLERPHRPPHGLDAELVAAGRVRLREVGEAGHSACITWPSHREDAGGRRLQEARRRAQPKLPRRSPPASSPAHALCKRAARSSTCGCTRRCRRRHWRCGPGRPQHACRPSRGRRSAASGLDPRPPRRPRAGRLRPRPRLRCCWAESPRPAASQKPHTHGVTRGQSGAKPCWARSQEAVCSVIAPL
jgi:hypothetical protein